MLTYAGREAMALSPAVPAHGSDQVCSRRARQPGRQEALSRPVHAKPSSRQRGGYKRCVQGAADEACRMLPVSHLVVSSEAKGGARR